MNRIGRSIRIKVIVRISMVAMFVHSIVPLVWAQSTDVTPPSFQIDSATYQRVVDENLDLRKEKSRMEAEVGELRQRNAALLLDVQDLERKKNQLAMVMSQLKTPEETSAEIAKFQAEKQILMHEIDRLRRALAEVPPPVTPAPPSASPAPPVVAPVPGSDLFRKIEKENSDLRQDLTRSREAIQKESASRELLAKNEARLQAEIKTLSGQIKQVSSELDQARRRETALKNALESEARKAFEATRKVEEAQKAKSEAGGAVTDKAMTKSVAVSRGGVAKAGGAQSDKGVDIIDLRSEANVASLLAEGKMMLAAKRVDDAEAIYLKAFKLEPKNPQVSYNLGVLYGDYLKDTRKAAKFYRRYIELAPRAPDVAAVRAWLMELDARSKW